MQTTQILAVGRCDFTLFDGCGELPLFNPDIEMNPPLAVVRLWQHIQDVDVIVIASPEYAHGVTGVIKNTLDWLVGYSPFAY